MAGGLLEDRDELEALFIEVAEEMWGLGSEAEIVMVGGAWMLWHSQRKSTRDVDSARRFGSELRLAVDRVGSRNDLRKGWLNDDAAAFWPMTARYEDCERIFQHPGLDVWSPGPEVIFVMKLYRAEPQDREDLVLLWPDCRFESPEAAAEVFRLAYPQAPEDEYLVEYIADVQRDASTDG